MSFALEMPGHRRVAASSTAAISSLSVTAWRGRVVGIRKECNTKCRTSVRRQPKSVAQVQRATARLRERRVVQAPVSSGLAVGAGQKHWPVCGAVGRANKPLLGWFTVASCEHGVEDEGEHVHMPRCLSAPGGGAACRSGVGVPVKDGRCLSTRAVALAGRSAVLLLPVLLLAAGCRSGEVAEPPDGRDSTVVESRPSATAARDAASMRVMPLTTVLPGWAGDSEDEPSVLSDAVVSTVAPDGTRWVPPVLPLCSDLVFPEGAVAELADPSPFWNSDPPSVSFGERTVSAMHAPAPDWAYSAVQAVIYAERADQRAFDDQFLFVTVTSESGSERTHRLPLAPPAEVHPSLRTAASAGRIVATADGWMIPVSVTTYMNSRLLVSEYFAEHAPGVGEAMPHHHEELQISGLRISVTNWSGYDGADYVDTCFASWAELGTTEELYDQYGVFVGFNKPYTSVSQDSGYVWASGWDGEPVQAELPDQWGECCNIQVLDNGYLAFSSTAQFGAPVWPYHGPRLHYSSDGFEWHKVELPTTKFFYEYGNCDDPTDDRCFDIPIWVCSVESTDSGVLIAQGQGHSHNGTMCDTVRHWTADADLTNWRLHPDAPAADD